MLRLTAPLALLLLVLTGQASAESIDWTKRDHVFQVGDQVWTNVLDPNPEDLFDANGFVFPHCFPDYDETRRYCTLVKAIVIGSYVGNAAVRLRTKLWLKEGKTRPYSLAWVIVTESEIDAEVAELSQGDVKILGKPLYIVAIPKNNRPPDIRYAFDAVPEQRVLLSDSPY